MLPLVEWKHQLLLTIINRPLDSHIWSVQLLHSSENVYILEELCLVLIVEKITPRILQSVLLLQYKLL